MSGGVVAAVDLAPHATQVLEVAAELAQRLGRPLTVLHVVSDRELEDHQRDTPQEGAYLDVLFEQVRGGIRTDLEARLGREAAASIRIEVARGEPDETIVEHLREGGYEYGVIGLRSRSRVGKLVFGSVAQSVLLLAPCPIVAVPVGA